MTNEIELHIHCHGLPGARFEGRTQVRLGVQKGDEVVDDVCADVKSATFVVPLRVRRNSKNDRPQFSGTYVRTTDKQRFIYLSWGERDEAGNWIMFRRAKVGVEHLDWETVQSAIESGRPLQAFIAMTDEKGGPLCASVGEEKIVWKV